MSNPLLNADQWRNSAATGDNVMTINGTVAKTGFFLLLMLLMFAATWDSLERTKLIFTMAVGPVLLGSAIAGLVLALIAGFFPRSTPITGTLYVLCQGVLLGGVSYVYNVQYKGLPLLAAALTIGTLMGMLFLYTQRIIRATPMVLKVIIGATVGLAIGVGILFLLNLFGLATGVTATLSGSGPIGIGFSVLCVGLAAFNLIVDFHFIESASDNRQPKYMEWVGALALVVTLIWLYLEILRLLAKLRQR
jgi:uncharacterized YccA/Bax inhibitor family protein